ncbi:MAG: alpha/beta fold hydrolase [Acidobacteriota bacterium]
MTVSRSPNSPWFQIRSATTDARLRLFCFPYAGGGASVYRTWRDALPNSVQVVPIQLPGRESRLREPAFRRMEALIASLDGAIRPLLDRPYAFFGHSLGASIAYELARTIEASGAKGPVRLITSGRRPPHLPQIKEPIHDLPDDAFVDALRDLEGTPDEALANAELMQLLMPLLRADFELVESYSDTWQDDRPQVSCPVTAFGGLRDRDVPREDVEAWSRYGEPFRLRMFQGGHFFLNDEATRPLVLEAVTRELARYL